MKRMIAILLGVLCIMVFAAGCVRTEIAQDRYGCWNQTDWETASAEEHRSAVRYLAREVAASCADDDKAPQQDIDHAVESLTAPQYEDIERTVDAYFASAPSTDTLQDAVGSLRTAFGRYLPID